MIFFCDNSGLIFKVVPEKVYQGSVNAIVIYFVGAFDQDCVITARFTLPNGLYATEQIMSSAYTALPGDIQTENGIKYGVWSLALNSVVTELSGTVQVQFTVTNANVNGVAATICTALSSFPVEKGVPVLQDDSIDNYETLLTQIKAVLAAIQNGDSENNIASAENAAAAQASAIMALAYAEQAKVNAGTQVTVGGMFQETWNADTKLDKPIGYISDTYVLIWQEEKISCRALSLSPRSTSLPVYGTASNNGTVEGNGGYLSTSVPVNDYHCANKKYVDAKTALYKTTIIVNDSGTSYTFFVNTTKEINETSITFGDLCLLLSETGEDYSGANVFIFEHILIGSSLEFIVAVTDGTDDDETIRIGSKVGSTTLHVTAISITADCSASSIKVY